MWVAPDGALQPTHLSQAVFHTVIACVVEGLLGAPNGHGWFVGHLFGAAQGARHHGFLRVEHLRHQAVVERAGGT